MFRRLLLASLLSVLCGCVLVSGGIPTTTAASGDLITNNSFEDGMTGWAGQNLDNDQVICQAQYAHSGTCTFVFSGEAASAANILFQTVSVPDGSAGDTLDLSVWAGALNLPGGSQVLFGMQRYQGGSFTGEQALTPVPTGSFNYQQLSVNHTAAADYDAVRLGFYVRAENGKVGFDDVSLAIPTVPGDTDQFIEDTFLIQSSYNQVRCVSGSGSCPAQIETAPPCLTASCTPNPQTYPVAATHTTIQAAADAAQPGDLVIIMPGTYRGVIVEEDGGADNAYIHFRGWGEPGSVVVDETSDPGLPWLRDLFYFVDSHHYIIENITFENAERAGIFLTGYFIATGSFSHHFVVMDVYSRDNGEWGMHTTSTSEMLIQDSVFTTSIDEHGLYISGSGDNAVVRRSVFQGNNLSGLQVNADPFTAALELFGWLQSESGDSTPCGISESDLYASDGSGTWQDVKDCYDSLGLPDLGAYIEDGISENLIIEQNVMTGNGANGAAGINLASVRHSIVRSNLIYGNDAAAIACWDDNYAANKGLPSSEFGCLNVTIVNNTAVDEQATRTGVGLDNDARSMTVRNNIIVRPRSDAYEISDRSGQDLFSGHNAYYALSVVNSSGWIEIDTDPGSGSITGFSIPQILSEFVDPNFNPWIVVDGSWWVLNPNRPDFTPAAGSMLLTAGDPDYVPEADVSGDGFNGTEMGAYAAP
ncbi:MAG: right-handed parallel beta-helix repeat-containing protein [Anaerolineae bacterium]